MTIHLRASRLVLAPIFATVLVVAGIGVAAATGGDHGGNPAPATSTAAPAITPKSALKGGQSEVYSGITPCRIFDTRPGAPIVNTTRNFKVSGSLAAQAGGACGVPSNASTVVVNLTAISAGGSGYVRGWAYNSTPAAATLLSYTATASATNMVNIPLCRGTGCTYAMTLKAFGSADVVGDVLGYYTPPMYALINNSGQIVTGQSSGTVSAARNNTGDYTVTFDRSVEGCAVNTTDEIWAYNRDVSASAFDGANVAIVVRDPSDALTDTWFYISVTC